jgi:hypothetical protein
MSAAQAVPRAAAAKGIIKPAAKGGQAGAKLYSSLFFEFSDGKGCDLAALQTANGNSELAFDEEGQLKWELGLGASLKLNCGNPNDGMFRDLRRRKINFAQLVTARHD